MRRLSQPFATSFQRSLTVTTRSVVVEEENENDANVDVDGDADGDARAASMRHLNQIQQQQNSRLQDKLKRQARTHALLVSIVVVFALSWFPLNVLNLILDIYDIFQVL